MEYAAIKSAVEKLNASGATTSAIKTVAVKAETVKAEFIKAVGELGLEKVLTLDKDIILAFVFVVAAVPDAEYGNLPEATRAVYDGLPDEYFSQPAPEAPAEGAAPEAPKEKTPKAPKEPKKPGDKGYKSECADFGKKCDETSQLCQSCKTSRGDEYTVCAEKTAAKKNTGGNLPAREKNELGHIKGGMGDTIDAFLLAGPAYADDIVKALMEKHGKDATKAKDKLKAHVSWMINREGHKIEQTVEGTGEAARTLLNLTKKS